MTKRKSVGTTVLSAEPVTPSARKAATITTQPVSGKRSRNSSSGKQVAVEPVTPQSVKKAKISHKRIRSHTAPAVAAVLNDENTSATLNAADQTLAGSSIPAAPKVKTKSRQSIGGSVDDGVPLKSHCIAFLQELMGLKDPKGRQIAAIFHELPSKDLYPDYYAVILHPISLREIKSKAGKYQEMAEFKADLDQMFDNATAYNIEGSDVYKDAVYLKKYVSKKLSKTAISSAGLPKTPMVASANKSTKKQVSLAAEEAAVPIPPATPAPSGKSSKKSVTAAIAETPASTIDKKKRGVPKTPAVPSSSPAPSKVVAEEKKSTIKKKKPVVGRQELKRLVKAIENGDEATFKQVTTLPGFDPNVMIDSQLFEAKYQWGALHCAAFHGQLSFVKELVDGLGAVVDQEDGWLGGTPLAWAAYGDRLECARYLTEKGADRKKKNQHDQLAIDLVPEPQDPKWHGILVDMPAAKTKISSARPGINPLAKIKTIYDKLVRLTDADGRYYSAIFMELPSRKQYPDYFTLIKRPIAFSAIEKRLKTAYYDTLEKYEEEMLRVLQNAMFYNESDSQVYKDAEFLKTKFDEFLDCAKQGQPIGEGPPPTAPKQSAGIKLRVSLPAAPVAHEESSSIAVKTPKVKLKLPFQTAPATVPAPPKSSAMAVVAATEVLGKPKRLSLGATLQPISTAAAALPPSSTGKDQATAGVKPVSPVATVSSTTATSAAMFSQHFAAALQQQMLGGVMTPAMDGQTLALLSQQFQQFQQLQMQQQQQQLQLQQHQLQPSLMLMQPQAKPLTTARLPPILTKLHITGQPPAASDTLSVRSGPVEEETDYGPAAMRWTFQSTMNKRGFAFVAPSAVQSLRLCCMLSARQEIVATPAPKKDGEEAEGDSEINAVTTITELTEPQLLLVLHNGRRVDQPTLAEDGAVQLSLKLQPGINSVEIQTSATVRSPNTEDREVRQSTHLSIIQN